jgi:hypothetical protein
LAESARCRSISTVSNGRFAVVSARSSPSGETIQLRPSPRT